MAQRQSQIQAEKPDSQAKQSDEVIPKEGDDDKTEEEKVTQTKENEPTP